MRSPGVEEVDSDLRVSLLARLDVVFVPGDPPRAGRFAMVGPGGTDLPDGALRELSPDGGAGHVDGIELVVPVGGRPRCKLVVATVLTPGEALGVLLDAPFDARPSPAAWSAVLAAGLTLVARGRLLPAVTPSGFDAWRVGPLDPASARLADELAAALPWIGHAVRLSSRGPIRVRSPLASVLAAWDAVADALVRTEAAALATGATLFARPEPGEAAHLRPWLVEAEGGLDGGASVALRVELGAHEPDEQRAGDDSDVAHPVGRAVVQLSSRADPSLVVDAADFFGAPAAVISRFGDGAETELLLALRRGVRAWARLEPLLRGRIPIGLDLDEDALEDLLGEAAPALSGAGIDVLWPADLVTDGLALRAEVVGAPQPMTAGGFDLGSLLEFRWQLTLGGELLDEDEIAQLAEAKRGLVRLRGRFVAADPALLARAGARRAQRMSAAEALGALLAGELVVDGEVVEVRAGGPLARLAERLQALATGGRSSLPAPAGLAGRLRPYQRRGVAWLHEMCALGLGGCLADDMGLGKTIQVIALHLHRRRAGAGPTLVVCPASLLGNWERELRRFAPSVPVRRYHGGGRHLEGLAQDEVAIATYGVARRDSEALAAANFSLVVADEAQHAKNPRSETARALRAIPARARVALSGTPVENQLSELWSILDWTTPGLLGPLERFRRSVALPVERFRDPAATERLSRAIRPFLLRRRKTDPGVAPDLPPRTVTDRPVPLTPEQVTLYEAEVREALDAIRGAKGIARSGLVFRLLTVLKQICNHPAQYLHQPGPLAGRSGKLAALEELLEVILAEGESVLVFSQYVECCTLLQGRLAELGVGTLFLHGGVPVRSRDAIVAAFQSGDAPVFLLSLKAGGVGLNLTQATHVIHYDRWWNPAVEDQATDRAHRIGQDRPVQVHRLVAEGTIEDRVAELLEGKRGLAEAVVGAGEAWITELSDQELADLVALSRGDPGGSR